MRRVLITSLATLILVIGAAGAAPAAQAQGTVPEGGACTDGGDCSGSGTCINSICTKDPLGTTPPASSVAPATPGTDNPATPPPPDEYNGIMIRIMSLFAWLVGVAALTLDYAVFYTVVKMGAFVSSLTAVGVAWRILRDFANILLIFGFLGAGIATILNVDQYGWSTKMLPKLLIAAVLINFSLFVSEAMIDGTNLVATEIYTQINGGTLPTDTPAGLTTNGVALTTKNEGISVKLMNQLGLQTIYGQATTQDPAKAQALFNGGNPWLIGFMGVLLFITTAFVMFSLAFILIARFVFLIFLILVSPVAFMGWAVPWLEYRMDQWWKHFLDQIITAPVLLLLLYVALAVITDAQFLTGFGTASTNVANSNINAGAWLGWININGGNLAGFASMMLSFLVAMGLLMVVVIKAKTMSAFGAAGATKLAGKLTFGATAWAGRSTVGWGSNKAGKYLGRTWVGRVPFAGTGLVKGLDRVGKSSFDLRGAKAFGELGINAGAAQKGGYQADLKARIKTRTDYSENLLTGKDLTPDQKAQQTALQNRIKELQKKMAKEEDTDKVKEFNKQIGDLESTLAEVEEKTKAGVQRKYSNVLTLGAKPNKVLNFLNPAANTEAAKIIRAGAKKGKPDKDFSANMKKLLKEAAEESGEGPATPSTTASTTPPPGPTPTPGGGPPPTP